MKKIRFGRGERTGVRDDVEFVGIRTVDLPSWERFISDGKKKAPPMNWLVRVRGLRKLLGPYPSIAQAWTTYHEMDEKDRALLRMQEERP
jgi:hypothetical protein